MYLFRTIAHPLFSYSILENFVLTNLERTEKKNPNQTKPNQNQNQKAPKNPKNLRYSIFADILERQKAMKRLEAETDVHSHICKALLEVQKPISLYTRVED